jgi:outer membrane protein OmpA-like peptidoglycan-associated protein/tetratricopeptide (TPR) repeat protein
MNTYKALCFVLLLSQLVFLTSLHAQEEKELLEKADRYYSKGDLENALNFYLKAEQKKPSDPRIQLRIGLTYLSTTSQKFRALPHLKKAYDLQSNVDPDIEYYLAAAYQVNHEFSEARQHYEVYKQKYKRMATIAQHKIEECVRGDSLVHHATEAIITNLGRAINSPFHDYGPLLYPDGSAIIFTSNRKIVNSEINEATENFENIFLSIAHDGSWTTPGALGPEINVEHHDAAASLSHDGKLLFIYYEEGYGDIYVSERIENEWGKPTPLNANINTQYWETSACISADGRRLYFASNRPGGYGELDIWFSERDGKGEWGKPKNLGPNVNTPGNEDSPFIHSDGVTLYFGSDAHPGLGGTDIFRSEFKSGMWQKPVNMGYPVNTADYDNYFVVSEDKKTGYFASVREDGIGETDLYKIVFLDPKPKVEVVIAPPIPAPDPVTKKDEDFVDPILQMQKELQIGVSLKGKVLDADTGTPMGARLTLTNNEKNEVLAIINSNPQTGEFELFIPHGGNFGVSTEKEGYLFNSNNFNLPASYELQELEIGIFMVKAEIGSKVVLKNIFFDIGKAELKQESVTELENIRELLDKNPSLKVQINGHTDNVGEATYNKTLSQRRARSVVDYLIQNGVDANRLAAVGYGEERPLVSNDDEADGREINRRTEIEIIESGTSAGN